MDNNKETAKQKLGLSGALQMSKYSKRDRFVLSKLVKDDGNKTATEWEKQFKKVLGT